MLFRSVARAGWREGMAARHPGVGGGGRCPIGRARESMPPPVTGPAVTALWRGVSATALPAPAPIPAAPANAGDQALAAAEAFGEVEPMGRRQKPQAPSCSPVGRWAIKARKAWSRPRLLALGSSWTRAERKTPRRMSSRLSLWLAAACTWRSLASAARFLSRSASDRKSTRLNSSHSSVSRMPSSA